MTLHEAIESVLQKSNEPMRARDIASEINKYSLYRRKDEKPVTPNQVWARVKQYDTIFQTDEEAAVRLISEDSIRIKEFFSWIRNLLVHNPEQDLDIIILYLVYILRSSTRVDQNHRADVLFDWAKLLQSKNPQELLLKTLYFRNSTNLPVEFFELMVSVFERVNSQYLQNIISGINNFYDLLIELTESDFIVFFSNLIQQVSSKEVKSFQFGTPLLIAKFISGLSEIKAHQKVCDPFAGFSSLLSEITSNLKTVKVFANDINPRVGSIGIFNLLLNTKNDISFTFNDAFQTYIDETFDRIVSNPPFQRGQIASDIKSKNRNEWIEPVEYIYSRLKKRGKAIVVVADSFLFNSAKRYIDLRKYLLSEGAISSIISLPSGIFLPYSNLNTSIIVLEKYTNDDGVFFADFRDISKSEFEYKIADFITLVQKRTLIEDITAVVDEAEIMNDESVNLLPKRFLLNQQLLSLNFANAVKLKDLIKRKIKGVSVPFSNLNEEQDGVPYLEISDLSNNSDVPVIFSSPKKFISDPELIDSVIKPVEWGTLVIAKVGSKLRPSIYGYEEPAIANSNLFCFVVDVLKVNPWFLAKELNSDYITKQIESIRITGFSNNSIREKDLLNLKVILPSLKEQKFRAHKINEQISYLTNKQPIHSGLLSDMAVEYISSNPVGISYREIAKKVDKVIQEKEIISSIKHRISQYVSPISNDLQNLQIYHERKSREKTSITLEDKISGRDNALTIQAVFKRINSNLKGIGETFDLMNKILYYNKVDNRFEELNIKNVIDKAYQSVEDKMDGIIYICETELSVLAKDLIIRIDTLQIEELLRNFFINAIKHGFDNTIPKKIISIFISKNADKNLLEINLINNGKPFPEGFTLEDFKSFGTKGNDSGGTGIGGYLMNKIVENHNGKLEWLSDQYLSFSVEDENKETVTSVATVHFRISLPYIN